MDGFRRFEKVCACGEAPGGDSDQDIIPDRKRAKKITLVNGTLFVCWVLCTIISSPCHNCASQALFSYIFSYFYFTNEILMLRRLSDFSRPQGFQVSRSRLEPEENV